MYLYQCSNVTPVTGFQSIFSIVASLLCLQVLNSSVSSIFPLHFTTSFWVLLFFFLPATGSLFAKALNYTLKYYLFDFVWLDPDFQYWLNQPFFKDWGM
jgi:hypothetical protein